MSAPSPFSLDGRTVLVVGASSGIGAATARVANALGAHVLLGRSLARKLGPVRINMLTNVWNETERANLAQWMETALSVRRAGRPVRIPQAAIALMTNARMTGAVITVDGCPYLRTNEWPPN